MTERKLSLDSATNNNILTLEIIIVGDKNVGKKLLIKNIKHTYISSIINNNIELYTLYNINNTETILEKYYIWKINTLLETFFLTPISILVYDSTDYNTFLSIKQKWHSYTLKYNSNSINIVLSNKYDIKYETDFSQEAKNWCNIHNCIFLEISALFGYNIDNLMEILLNYVNNKKQNNTLKNKDAKSRYWCC